jgi:hypothetical protein
VTSKVWSPYERGNEGHRPPVAAQPGPTRDRSLQAVEV